MTSKGRVLVAMSGGVDSSVAALILKEQGYDVIGITFQLYDFSRSNRREGKGGCCSLEDVHDARSVCLKLGIRHYLFDSRERFKKRVVDYFAESYKAGKTPNPCVACNTFIKFDELGYYADQVGADFYATGHYVRLKQTEYGPQISRADDPLKDQSYFLVGVEDKHLSRCLFPIGEYSKAEIRELAEKAGLPVSQKPDSMEVCFIPENNYRKFLQNDYGVQDDPGEFVDEGGRKLGVHAGIHYFTIGQRKGLGAFGLDAFYVVRIEPKTKRVILGRDEKLLAQGLEAHVIRWMGDEFHDDLTVKIRSRSPYISLKEVHKNGTIQALFEVPQRAVTPGQFAVFYQGNRVVGGGPIVRPMSEWDRARSDGRDSKETRCAV